MFDEPEAKEFSLCYGWQINIWKKCLFTGQHGCVKELSFPRYFRGVFGIFRSLFLVRIMGIFCPLSALFCAKRILGRYWAKNAQKRHQELTWKCHREPNIMFRAENAPDLGFIWAKNAQNLYRIMPIFQGKKRGIPKNRVSHFFRTYFRNVFEKKQKRNYMAG